MLHILFTCQPSPGTDTSAGPLPSITLGNTLQVFYLQKQNKTNPKNNLSLVGAISFSATSQVKTNSTVLCQNKNVCSVSSPKRVRLCRLWQSFTCLSIHCHSLLLKINLPSCPSRAKVNKYKVIAGRSQEELCEPQSQLQLQQEI